MAVPRRIDDIRLPRLSLDAMVKTLFVRNVGSLVGSRYRNLAFTLSDKSGDISSQSSGRVGIDSLVRGSGVLIRRAMSVNLLKSTSLSEFVSTMSTLLCRCVNRVMLIKGMTHKSSLYYIYLMVIILFLLIAMIHSVNPITLTIS